MATPTSNKTQNRTRRKNPSARKPPLTAPSKNMPVRVAPIPNAMPHRAITRSTFHFAVAYHFSQWTIESSGTLFLLAPFSAG